ncbi:phosphatidylethanolamine N-methyltransferase [Orbilia oligospora]|uniref:Phosphatidylethanolamine N-methyltransferase n=1 Tax=Orbilia oligospora TaxID=2813651 RepID=A0A7C8NHV5_ORBOL|nr:phosphatidylethanolamine N-methyltransferase [Orbilia oligospora]
MATGHTSADLPGTANSTPQVRERTKSSKKQQKLSPKLTTETLNDGDLKPRSEIEKEAKTYGRTPDGTVFVVPQTHDMVSTLLSPKEPKNLSDLLVLGVLAFHISLLFILPQWSLKPVFMFTFLFWRAGYNLGIGLLLQSQSKYKQLTHWAAKYKLFDREAHPVLYDFIKREISTKIPSEDYDFDKAPLEYNTWMVFRRLVDLILMCDFVNYVLFAYVATEVPTSHKMWLHVCRWVAGVVLFVFNVWVKLDAHRVVKDYAWYWGDFFFMIDQSLTFDGVYEIAPHPMYSVGYAGYYGISLFSASYTVFAISLIAHAAQFAFLVLIEDPHIQKIYSPPPQKRKAPQKPTLIIEDSATSSLARDVSPPPSISSSDFPEPSEEQPIMRPLVGYKNFDFVRTPDLQLLFLGIYMVSLALLVPATPLTQALFIFHALFWRLFYSVGLGIILNLQSERKSWTRHFLKYGESLDESWRQWRSLFHMVNCMCHLSFGAACWKVYSPPENWSTDMASLKHMLGFLLVALQMWAAASIYDSVGEFGWFYGDFFFDTRPKLTYSGIYRFLNNPERLFGCASVWGLALVTSNPAIYLLALLAHIATHLSIDFVERPHMEKLYGDLRQDAGVAKTLKRAVPKDLNDRLQRIQGSLDKVANTTTDLVEEFLDRAMKRLSNNEEANTLLSDTPARTERRHLSFPTSSRILFSGIPANELSKLDLSLYSISILSAKHSPKPPGSAIDTFSPLSVSYGSAVRIAWTAPRLHSKKDWIGLYRVNDNSKRAVTGTASMGRWTAVSRGEYPQYDEESILICDAKQPIDETHDDEYVRGEAIFEGHRLFWHTGVYEFRYHHGGRHNVMAISLPFEVVVDKFDESSSTPGKIINVDEILKPLVGVVRDCFDRKEDLAPESADDEFGEVAEMKYAKRIVYAVKEMFGLDLAPEVVRADGTVRKLAWRIVNAKRVLAPFSLSRSSPSAPSSPIEA